MLLLQSGQYLFTRDSGHSPVQDHERRFACAGDLQRPVSVLCFEQVVAFFKERHAQETANHLVVVDDHDVRPGHRALASRSKRSTAELSRSAASRMFPAASRVLGSSDRRSINSA